MVIWRTVELKGALNTAIAAAATEQIEDSPDRVDYFNFLIVQNFDTAVDCQILLDSGNSVANAAANGKLFTAQFNGGSINIKPEDGIHFRQIVNRNPHSATAQTVNKISFIYGRSVRVG